MRRRWIALLAIVVSVAAIFDQLAYEINQANAKLRVFVVMGDVGIRSFDENGIPFSRSARSGAEFVSPFYVVHYGLIYSETCSDVAAGDAYHWSDDSTVAYWNVPPEIVSKDRFRHAADWVVENVAVGDSGNAHLFYEFDWRYENVPGGKLTAPWWSGLTDGHAITLLLRAADCFGGDSYAEAARALYDSVLTPFGQGGSLTTLRGDPWIEEYADPDIPEPALSKVFNGMVYAYHGVRGFERRFGGRGMADALEDAIVSNTGVFDHGAWSYYDAIGTPANIKYHRINLALIKDPRLDNHPVLAESREMWRMGARHPGLFYVIHGPNTVAKLHFVVTFLLVVLICYALVRSAVFFVPRR